LAVRSEGNVWAWGSNASGRTGLGTVLEDTLVPNQIIYVELLGNFGRYLIAKGHFTVAEDSAFQLQKYSLFSSPSIGMGINSKFPALPDYDNIYATVKIHKVA
jgi:hypothetical protein